MKTLPLIALLLAVVLSTAPLVARVSGGAVVGESPEPKGTFVKLNVPLGNPFGPSTDNLAASDFLANTGVRYLNPSARGLEPGDLVTITGPNQITFHTVASNSGDYVRVLTEFSPKRITALPPVSTPSTPGFGQVLLRTPLFFPKSRDSLKQEESSD